MTYSSTEQHSFRGKQVDGDVLEPIAIIGFSLKYPEDGDSPEGFWKVLEEGRCVMTEWPKHRMRLDAFYEQDEAQDSQTAVPGAHFLKEDIGAFDAPFFGISATEAKAMDPQQRIILEGTYHALEQAGLTIENVSGSQTGVYSGCMTYDYKDITTRDLEDFPKYAATGITSNMLANRVSWFYNLLGPSITLDSACSSSLMAFDIACQGLRNGDCSMAVVTGSTLLASAEPFLTLINMGFLSPHGRCFSFDERANGYARGEGIGVVLLQPLRDAIAQGNPIRAIVRSTGSNQDGHTPGVTQPSKESQAALIRDTYEKAGLDFTHTRYFEAHGTGTAIGDPIEADAIGRTFRTARSKNDPLYIGAVKSNIGHLEGGSGIAGIIKTVMVLEKGIIPPNANFKSLNPKIDADFLNIKFPTQCLPWPTEGLRRASVASFGFGGSNAHAILDDPVHYMKLRGLRTNGNGTLSDSRFECLPAIPASESKPELDSTFGYAGRLLVLSAADEGGIARLASAYESYFHDDSKEGKGKASLDDFVYTLARRSSMPWKSFALVSSEKEVQNLTSLLSKPTLSDGQETSIAFVFTGQGAQYRNMGFHLLAHPRFKASIDSFDKQLHELGSTWSVGNLLCQKDSTVNIDDPEFSQPMTTALQVALYDMLLDAGVKPEVVIGHSSGEIAAAYTAGGLDLASTCKVSYYRGKTAGLLKQCTKRPGAMMSVDLSADDMRNLIGENLLDQAGAVCVACVNSPYNVTISGDETAIDAMKSLLDSLNIRTRKLNTGIAYHSPHMEQIAAEYAQLIGKLRGSTDTSSRPHMISSLTGTHLHKLDNLRTSGYWVANMVSPVQFREAMLTLSPYLGKKQTRKLGGPKIGVIRDVIEIGPQSALRRIVMDCVRHDADGVNVQYDSVLARNHPEGYTTLKLIGSLYTRGHTVSIQRANEIVHPLSVKSQLLVDLPSYPFDHSKIYWHEALVSRHGRLRTAPKLELLGVPVPDWNPLEPRWRKFLNIAETPWIEHHKVNGIVIYPATGMLVMVVEALKQLSDASRSISGYRFTDAVFSAPIVIREGERTEVQLHMRRDQSFTSKDFNTYEFRVYAYIDKDWVQNCHGSVQINYDSEREALVRKKETLMYRQKYEAALRSCTQKVSKEDMYDNFKGNGLTYGPAFQALHNLAWDGKNRAVGNIQCFTWSPHHSRHKRQEHVAHPVTGDAAGQLTWVALTRGAQDVFANGFAVTRIRSAWVASSGLSYQESEDLFAACETSFKGLRGTASSTCVFDAMGNLKLVMANVETTTIGGSESLSLSVDPRQLCFELSYKPDPDSIDPRKLFLLEQTGPTEESERTAFYEDLESALFYFATRALLLTDSCNSDNHSLKADTESYVAWLRRKVHEYQAEALSCGRRDHIVRTEDTNEMDGLINRLENANLEGQLFIRVGRNLHSIIRELVDPLELVFQDGLAEKYCQTVCESVLGHGRLINYLDVLSHKHPYLNILEVGSGTGPLVHHILDALCAKQEVLGRYDYTDISEAMLERARQVPSGLDRKIKYKMLDIGKNIAQQGYEPESYDLVVANMVFNVTRDLETAIQNIRLLLKPHGKLLLLKTTNPDTLRSGVVFGTMPVCWMRTEEDEDFGPSLSSVKLEMVLKANGFGGVETISPSHQGGASYEHSIMVATATTPLASTKPLPPVFLILDPQDAVQATVAEDLRGCLQQYLGLDSQVLSIKDIIPSDVTSDSTLVFLVEILKPYLATLDKSSFERTQGLLSRAGNMIWTTSAQTSSTMSADLQMIRGLARVLQTEKPDSAFITLTLEDHNSKPDVYVQHIWNVIYATVTRPSDICELEYVEHEHELEISRVFHSRELDHEIHSKIHTTLKQESLDQCPPLALTVPHPGLLESIRFEEDTKYPTELEADEIEIQVQAIGINFRDLLVILGRVGSDTVGAECAGVVTRIGANCNTLNVGDRVCAVAFAVKIPDDLPVEKAASLPITGVTAYYSLHTLAQLRKDDSILIHSAAGGTGQMAVQIAQSAGAEVYVTVGTPEKRQLMRDFRDASFAQDIFHATNGKGVDVIVNSLAGDLLQASWNCIAPLGRFIELGKADIEGNSKLPMFHFDKNVTFYAVAVDSLSDQRPSLVGNILQSVVDLATSGQLQVASPLQVSPISDIEAGLKTMQSGRNVGKAVLTINPNDKVPTWLKPTYSCSFDPAATYLIAGGLGGLGRCAARWMSRQGAKHFILLSRSGPRTDEARGLLEELRAEGVDVRTPKCDVSSPESLEAALNECSDMPPIKGCLQATMVLQDVIFETMSWDQWSISINSKVRTTWNLHAQLPRDLTFFIMLSSVSGIMGSIGQSNYAAGNTYQDALAAHRIAMGEAATALALGWMGNIGIGAANAKLDRGKEEMMKIAEVHEDEFLALLDRYCNPATDIKTVQQAQPIVGLLTPAKVQAAGFDPPDWMLTRPLLQGLKQHDADGDAGKLASQGSGAAAGGRDWRGELVRASTMDEASHILVEALVQKLAKATSVAPEEIDSSRPLHAYGVDSLLAVELRNWFKKLFQADVAIFDITGQASVEQIARGAARVSEIVKESGLLKMTNGS
ncbi:BcPKS1, polyketide synthase [Xylaria scruposa]|nr:BcPKS1, polyketide synthase [Xylaria scruposa]